MNPLHPPEDPEFKSEPKALSPVSPKPLHIPLPSNIPLLQSQAHMEGASSDVEQSNVAESQAQETETNGTSAPVDEKSNNEAMNSEMQAESMDDNHTDDAAPQPQAHETHEATQVPTTDTATQPASIVGAPDYQALLNSLTKPTAIASQPAAPSYIPLEDSLPSSNLASLPARPPPQAQPTAQSNYAQPIDLRQYHPPGANVNSSSALTQGANGLPPPPIPSFQAALAPGSPLSASRGKFEEDDESKWSAETQKEFDNFLEQERHFVTEGNWEQFPFGSRLFVGNLSSERVTKRDVFHVFHTYGPLAQISIKQAYGFVQFLNEPDCARAMSAEQGRTIRGKKINLEISKPQKNSRNSGGGRRRSRSPDRGPDRYTGGGRRARDDYRPNRSPSPRNRRDRSRDRHGRYRSRSRSPRGRRDRHRSPPRREDDDDDLPLPRRAPRDVPDVQIIAVDNVDRGFIQWVEQAISARGIKVDVLILSPRLSEVAVVKRQILEGVTAVVRLASANQHTGKIPLQVFDRRGAPDVRFEEYADLDPPIAAEVVLRARTNNQPSYGYGYGGDSGKQQQGLPPNISNAISSMDANGLQKLLGAMQGQPGTPDLSKLLGGGQPGPPPHSGYGQPPANQDPLAALRNNPALAGLLGGQAPPNPPPQQQQQRPPSGAGQPDMADILAKLGSYRR